MNPTDSPDPHHAFREEMLPSEFQARPTRVQVLRPDTLEPGRRYPVLYILPVAGPNGEFGDGLEEARKADVANRYGVICVSPMFSLVPWYGNHPTDPQIRQEDHLLQVVIPWVDRTYPTQSDAEGRWLIGFSKSGWGACTLLMRHPGTFGYAAAWDAPLMIDGTNTGKDWGPMGMKKVYGDPDTMQHYLPTALAMDHAPALRVKTRLVLAPGKFWKPQVTAYHAHLEKLDIPHRYREDLVLPHRWDTGWFAPLVDDLVLIARDTPRP